MQLSIEHQKRFPKFKEFVLVTAPRLANTDVVAEMADLTGLAETTIRAALISGGLPKVLIVDKLNCRGGEAAGCFRPAQPDEIEINRMEVENDEKGARRPGWVDRSVGGVKLRHSHVTLLHELGHNAASRIMPRRRSRTRRPPGLSSAACRHNQGACGIAKARRLAGPRFAQPRTKGANRWAGTKTSGPIIRQLMPMAC